MYYSTDEMLKTMNLAKKGDAEAIQFINSLGVPYAVAEDYSAMILVQEKHIDINDNGLLQIRNMPPSGSSRKQVADIYDCNELVASWTSIPVPYCFVIRKVEYADGLFRFESEDHKTIAGTLPQIRAAMRDVAYAIHGVLETQIETCFFSIPSTQVSPAPSRKTTADNPKIVDDLLGELTFDERLQKCTTTYRDDSYSFDVIIVDVTSHDKALALVRTVRGFVNNLASNDAKARRFASDALLGLKNDTWLEEGEEPVTEAEFISRMGITSIWLFGESVKFTIWYSDGDLFWGHLITVDFDVNGEPDFAEIAG